MIEVAVADDEVEEDMGPDEGAVVIGAGDNLTKVLLVVHYCTNEKSEFRRLKKRFVQ